MGRYDRCGRHDVPNDQDSGWQHFVVRDTCGDIDATPTDMLGLEPVGDHLVIDPALPAGIGRIELLDIPGRWGRIDAFGRAG